MSATPKKCLHGVVNCDFAGCKRITELETELAAAQSKLAEIEKAANLPDYLGKHLKPISINGNNGFATCDADDKDAAFYKRVEVNRYLDQLRDHSRNLAAKLAEIEKAAELPTAPTEYIFRAYDLAARIPTGTSLVLTGAYNTLRAHALHLAAENLRLREDAERYRYLRAMHWERDAICCVKFPKKNVKLGSDCPSEERLDGFIDHMRKVKA